jgi:alkylation response protein AidB-like acyl-CoA dehydrogenase
MTMTDRPTTPRTSTDVLTNAEDLAPRVAGRAAEVEAARRVPEDLLQDLVDAGCFRLLLPGTHGGLGADLPRALQVYEVLARADASVGWTVMIGSGSWADLTRLPRATFDAMYADGPDAIAAGAFNPSGGRIEPVEGGYRVTGRWAFASGCEHARWLWGNCVAGVVDGMPQLRVALFDRSQVEIEDTWDAVGLRGTGSHHFHVDGLVVPAERTCIPMGDPSCLDEPIARVPAPALFALGIAAVALGTAQGALDDITAMAGARMPLLAGSPLAASPTFHSRLATADTDLAAARALLRDAATSVWATAVARTEPTLEERARARAAAVWVVDRSAAAVEAAYLAGGSAALYADCSLQRRVRDVLALRQHFLVRADTMATAGSLLAGQELAVPVF